MNYYKLLICLFVFCSQTATARESWIDSAIAEGVYKIRRTEEIRSGNYIPTAWDNINHLNVASSYIVIDLAKWTPALTSGQFYYEKANSPQFITNGGGSFHIWDSLNTYHIKYEERSDFVAYYNIVLKNFPLELRKDISTVKTGEGQNLYTQLQQLGAIQTADYQESLDKFRLIIDNICVLAQTNFNLGKIVCYGSANFLGQYGNKSNKRASFGSYYVKYSGFAVQYPWLEDLLRIPKYMCPPIEELVKPSLEERNYKIALAVQHFIQCNVYNDCSMSSSEFSNQYAAWLFDNLKSAGNINKPLLLNTCIKLNQLSHEMAWSVLTADYENDFANYAYNPLGSLYTFYTNATLNSITAYTKHILRGEQQFLNNPGLNRDSVLYYGRLLYRIPSVIKTIGTTQRVKLLKTIAVSSCNDIMGATEASDYENHCERLCKSLYQNLTEGEEKNFLDQLKSTGVIWDLSYRLDNATFGFFGKDNYTDFIFTISAYWKKAYPEKSHPSTGGNINFYVYKWESAFFDNNGWIVANHSANTIASITSYRPGFNGTSGSGNYISDIYDPVMIHPLEGALIPDLPGVKDLVVPAIFLDWLSHKKTIDNIGTASHVALSALAFATGIGEFYAATSITIRVISAVEIAVSASDLILLNQNIQQSIISQFPTQQQGQEFLDAYQNITMAINVAVAAKGLLTHLDDNIQLFTAKFDEKEQALKTLLGESSAEFSGMKKLRGELGVVEASTQWLDNLETILGAGSKWKLQGWIDNGLDATKLESAFASTSEKLVLFNNLDNAKSVYHQRVYIQDWDNIPGVAAGNYTSNGLTIGKTNNIWNNQALDLPAVEATNFVNAFADELSAGTKIYRVTGGNKAGAYWVIEKPNLLGDVIGGTAVQPGWNSFEKMYVYEVPQGQNLKVWRGITSKQRVATEVNSPHLPGGIEQIFIPDIIRDNTFINLVQETPLPW